MLRSHLASMVLTASLLATPLLVGCGGDDDGDGTGGSGATSGEGGAGGAGQGGGGQGGAGGAGGAGGGEVQLGQIEVTVQYAGALTGPLSVAAVTNFPPNGPPLAAQTLDMPTFPATVTLIGLEPRDYYVVAVIDVGDNNPQMPGPEDPVSVSMPPVTVTGGETAMVELTLTDP